MQSLGLGTPGQNAGQQSQNMTNAINAAFANNKEAVTGSLQYLTDLLGLNPAPVQGWGNIAPPPQYGNGATLGGGGTNSLGALVNGPATTSPTPTIPGGAPAPAPALPPALGGGAQRSALPAARAPEPAPPAPPALASPNPSAPGQFGGSGLGTPQVPFIPFLPGGGIGQDPNPFGAFS